MTSLKTRVQSYWLGSSLLCNYPHSKPDNTKSFFTVGYSQQNPDLLYLSKENEFLRQEFQLEIHKRTFLDMALSSMEEFIQSDKFYDLSGVVEFHRIVMRAAFTENLGWSFLSLTFLSMKSLFCFFHAVKTSFHSKFV